MLEAVLIPAAVVVIVLVIARRCIDPHSVLYIADAPNERSLHHVPTPRAGGIAMLTAILTAWLLLWLLDHNPLPWLMLPVSLLVVLGVLDDWKNLRARTRFVFHLLAALAVVYFGFGLARIDLGGIVLTPPGWVLFVLSLGFILWMLNLYNFMDGMDGFAGGMTFFGFLTYAVLGLIKGAEAFALMSLTVSGAAAGFLWFNFPPARLFMGDSGSVPLGYTMAVFALWADRDGLFPLWISVVIFSPFVVDATVTLLKRVFQGHKIWHPHRSHYYQQLVRRGWSHRKTVVFEYFLMVVSAGFAIIAVLFGGMFHWLAAVGALLIYGILITVFHSFMDDTDR